MLRMTKTKKAVEEMLALDNLDPKTRLAAEMLYETIKQNEEDLADFET